MIDLKPAMSVKARITDVKTLPVGEGVSYGLNYRSPGAVKICTMPIGYADGFRRGLSGRTDVLLAGRRFHQVGNICMDQSMFEVNLRQRNDLAPQIGDTVTIVGEQGEASVTIDQMAETLGTIQHEWPSASAAQDCPDCTCRKRRSASIKAVQQVETKAMRSERREGVPRAVHSMAYENAATLGGKCHRMLFEHGTPSRRSPEASPKRNSRKKDARWSTPAFR